MYGFAALLVLVGAAFAQVPQPCHSPPQWECREIKVDPQQKFFERRRLVYDATNRRERRLEEIEIGTDKSYYDQLILWNENKMYQVDLKTRKCNVTVPYRPFFQRGTFPGEKFDYEGVIGAAGLPNEHVTIQQFSMNTTGEARTSLVSFPDCIPITNIHITTKYGYEQSNYYDVSVGISDPMAFIPPKECMG
ncbi:mammalian ependymin-related protein 1-like isoform X1 [Crassostrea virginica]|uniref:Mammalian ependymin-related protein 1-like isoform X1 n=1 Tax=Crassostrea virginica TaxID=6565 RepID=A0A8B8E0W3_CRAVI|nr:mammalian ependymin-related protein 1-like isoform X1 [Crassostrea virginica]